MKITSFDNTNKKIDRDSNQWGLFNLFQKNIMIPKNSNIQLYSYMVKIEDEMRLDKISNYLYGSPNYVEELMIMNDILNPYSIKEGQYISYCTYDNLQLLYTTDDLVEDDTTRNSMIKSSNPSKELDDSNENLPLTIKPQNLNQITITDDNKVKIINSFE